LKSAIANAENNAELKVDTLLVKEAVVGEGPTFKRFRARARGSASPLRKRTSHIRIVLSDELTPKAPIKRAERRSASREGSAAKKPKVDPDSVKEASGTLPAHEVAPQKVEEPAQPTEPVSETKPAEQKE